MKPILERKVFPDPVWSHVMRGGKKIRDIMEDYSQFFAESFIFFSGDERHAGEVSDFFFNKTVRVFPKVGMTEKQGISVGLDRSGYQPLSAQWYAPCLADYGKESGSQVSVRLICHEYTVRNWR